jgi:sirohydrochlorin ferrochelatase
VAAGHTAERISHELAISRATVRKHLENLYRKLGTTDRLGAVIQARDLGLLREDEVSRAFHGTCWPDARARMRGRRAPSVGPGCGLEPLGLR